MGNPKNISRMSHGKSKPEVLCDISNAYKIHASIKQIESKFNGQKFFGKEKPVTPMEIKKLIECFDVNKAAGLDTIPPKHLKIAADFLTLLLTAAINKSV